MLKIVDCYCSRANEKLQILNYSFGRFPRDENTSRTEDIYLRFSSETGRFIRTREDRKTCFRETRARAITKIERSLQRTGERETRIEYSGLPCRI